MLRLILLLAVILTTGAAHAGDPLSDALRAIDAGRHAQAAQLLLPLANSGNTLAQYRLGMLHYQGDGVPEDEKQAVFWWKKAAAQGHVESMFQLGSAYLFGVQAARTVADPDREAASWYFQAASAGHAEAQYHLGLLFLAGKGVVESHPEAIRWMKKAAAQGHVGAQRALSSVGK